MSGTVVAQRPNAGVGRRPASARIAAFLLTAGAIAFAVDVPQRLGIALYPEQYLAFLLAFTLALLFVGAPARRTDAAGTPWYDWLAAAIGLAAAGYVALRYPLLVNELVYKPLDGLIIGSALVLLVLEAARRAAGNGLALIVVAFVAYALLGDALPGSLAARPVQWDRLAIYLSLDTNGILGLPLMVAGAIVVSFILLGQVLAMSGGGDFFTDLSLALVGRRRGGPGKIAVISSMLFGSVSGSAVANVVGSGLITIPMMRRAGYPPHQAAAIEAVASTGGQLAPPIMGAAAFLMAEFLGIGYGEVLLAALAPTVLYYFALFVWVDAAAGRQAMRPMQAADMPALGTVLRSGWHFPLPFIVLLVLLFAFNWPPQNAALAATVVLAIGAALFGYRGQRMGPTGVLRAIEATGFAILEVLIICAAAGMVIGVLNLSGLAFGLTLELASLAAGNVLLLLFAAALASVVLGMGMPTVGVYVLLASLVAPAMVQAGFDPVASHLFLLYFGMLSMITPPVALASFTAATLAQADFWRTGWTAVRIGWVAYMLPFVLVFEPSLAFRDSPQLTAWHGLTAIVGVWYTTLAIVGFSGWRNMGTMARSLLGIAGLCAVLPVHALGVPSLWPNVAGILAGAWILWRSRSLARRSGVARA